MRWAKERNGNICVLLTALTKSATDAKKITYGDKFGAVGFVVPASPVQDKFVLIGVERFLQENKLMNITDSNDVPLKQDRRRRPEGRAGSRPAQSRRDSCDRALPASPFAAHRPVHELLPCDPEEIFCPYYFIREDNKYDWWLSKKLLFNKTLLIFVAIFIGRGIGIKLSIWWLLLA